MKNQNKTEQTFQSCVAACPRKQKVLGVVALVGLFACGWLTCMSVNAMRTHRVEKENIAVADDTETVSVAEVAQSENKPAEVRLCESVEELVKRQFSDMAGDMDTARDYYVLLLRDGCPENEAEYRAKIRALDIAKTFASKYTTPPMKPCEKLESELKMGLLTDINHPVPAVVHINNARIYANMAERGCEDNKPKYASLANQELELARAISDDEMNKEEIKDVVMTYKRLHMQQAAQSFFNKAKKLTNPAIDFILEMERIINE